MITIEDLSNSSSEHFKKFKPSTIRNQISAAKYIRQIAAQIGVNLEDVDALDIFAGSRKSMLMTSRPDINKRLFTYAKKNKVEPTSADLVLAGVVYREQEIKENWDKLSKKRAAGYKKNLAKAEKDKEKTNLTYRQQRLVDGRLSKWKLAVSRENTVNSEVLFNHLVNIARDKFWKFIGIIKGDIIWVTTRPVVLTEVNESAGLSLTQNMGHYIAVLKMSDCDVTIMPHKDNIEYEEHYHPHVSCDGDVCWGNTYNFVEKSKKDRDVSGLLAVARTILSSYSSAGGPFVDLVNFVNNSESIDDSTVVDPDDRLRELLTKKNNHAAKKVGELTKTIRSSHGSGEHCGDVECEDCNENYGEIW